MATVTNSSGVEDDTKTWKRYYVKIVADEGVFWKLGRCKGSVKKRFGKEPPLTQIEILNIWIYNTEDEVVRAEEILRAGLKGDRPFIGRCGPLQFGGNTETYSHDALNRAPAPHSFFVKMLSNCSSPEFTRAYSDVNPGERYGHLHGQVQYMDHLCGPEDVGEGPFLQVPNLSSPSHVVIATDEFLTKMLEPQGSGRWFKKADAADALYSAIIVERWREDYPKMRFYGDGFRDPF